MKRCYGVRLLMMVLSGIVSSNLFLKKAAILLHNLITIIINKYRMHYT